MIQTLVNRYHGTRRYLNVLVDILPSPLVIDGSGLAIVASFAL
jgi:hypothetical protein